MIGNSTHKKGASIAGDAWRRPVVLIAEPAGAAGSEVRSLRLSCAWVRVIITAAAARHGVSADVLITVAVCESDLDPDAIGSQGEIRLYQLHPRGLLRWFYAYGYDDPLDPAQQADFAARMFAQRQHVHRSCWWTEIAGMDPPWW